MAELVSELAVVVDDNLPAAGKFEDVFNELNKIDLTEKIAKKNNLSYLPWASAYEEVMKYDPNATFKILTTKAAEDGTKRFWFDDGKTAWVETEVTIKGRTIKSFPLPIMDFKNQAIKAEDVTTMNANKAVMRCLVKNIALFGLGLYIYQGEDLPEESRTLMSLRQEVNDLGNAKIKLGAEAKTKVTKLMKEAKEKAFPELDDVTEKKISEIEDEEILKTLKMKLSAIRVAPKKAAKGE